MMIIPLAPPSLAESSDLPGDFGRAVRKTSPYLVLLRAGFCLPPVLPRARCALTAPFHPYPPSPKRRRAVYFLCHYPSGCPDRALPGALPCGVRTFLPPKPEGRRRTIIWLAATLSIVQRASRKGRNGGRGRIKAGMAGAG